MCYLLLLPSLPRGQEDASQFEVAASSSPGFKGNSPEAEQCLRQLKPAGPRTGWGYWTSVVSLWYPRPGWKHALFFPPNWHGRACPVNSRGTEVWFPRDALMCVCWCSALMSNKVQAQVRTSPHWSCSWQLFPRWISGGPSRLRLLLFPLPSRRALVVFTLH